jgi:Mg2+ and Co2+ transporter CorA
MKIYDSKNNNKTNILITRLTVFTIIMGVWTVITGFFGMNFTGNGWDKEASPWYFLVVFAILALFTAISIIVLRIKKVI